jgi:hypothetical protein
MKRDQFIMVGNLLLAGAFVANIAFAQAKAKSEDEIGLRQETTLYDETNDATTAYGKAEGASNLQPRTVRRSFTTT